MRSGRLLAAFFSLTASTSAFSFHIWLGDKCTITGSRVSDTEILVFPERVDSKGCMVRSRIAMPKTNSHIDISLFQKYDLHDWGHDQSLMVRPEEDDGPDQC